MKYTPATIAKALFAFLAAFSAAATGAAHGLDLSGLDFGSWMLAIGAGLTGAGGVFAIPNKTDPAPSPADQIINNLPVIVQNVTDATTELERVRDAATGALNNVPVLGPLATQIINSLPKP